MKNEKSIDVLNSLITINNDRIEGYKTASDATEEHDLKSLFTRFIATSEKCNQELTKEVNMLGGEESDETKASGKFFRVWMDVKAALTGKDRKAVLNSCEFGEDKAQETYDDVLQDDLKHLNAEQQRMIHEQKQQLRKDRDHVMSLRDALVDA